jgi:DeoR/GlpR family transcriptional regulator of sugar metabolism
MHVKHHFMLPAERTQEILDRLELQNHVVAETLAAEFGVSEDTIRRDLRELAAKGLCKKVYGGALSLSDARHTAEERMMEAADRKPALGQKLANLLRPNQFVYIDAGSTNLAAARALPRSAQLTVATNDPMIAACLALRTDIDLIMVGGKVDSRTGCALGSHTMGVVQKMKFDVLILGTCAVDAIAGISSFQLEDASLKSVLIENASQIVTAVHSEKFFSIAPFHVCDANMIDDLVIEKTATPEQLKPFIENGVRLHPCS